MANYNKSYSYLLSSYAIKKVFLKRLKEFKFSLYEFTSIFGDPQEPLKKYFTSKKTSSHDNICEEQLIKYLEFLGIEVKILLNVISENDPRYNQLRQELRTAKKEFRVHQIRLEAKAEQYKANLELQNKKKGINQKKEEKLRVLKLRRELLIKQRKQDGNS
jgi:hypothetical protein